MFRKRVNLIETDRTNDWLNSSPRFLETCSLERLVSSFLLIENKFTEWKSCENLWRTNAPRVIVREFYCTIITRSHVTLLDRYPSIKFFRINFNFLFREVNLNLWLVKWKFGSRRVGEELKLKNILSLHSLIRPLVDLSTSFPSCESARC